MFQKLFLTLIRFYRKGVSPFTPASCRFIPTCSAYAQEAVERHGAVRGWWLFLKRFIRCHPFGGHGVDPVPPPGDERRREVLAGGDPAAEGRSGP